MPLTISHPAAILPFARREGLPLSALVIGSMLPDFPYFFPFLLGGSISHSLVGSIIFDLPVGLVSLWLFQVVLKQPLLDLLPPSLHARIPKQEDRNATRPWKRFGALCLALLVGIWSHIAWDSFTHLDGWFVQRSAFLRLHVVDIWGYQVFVYKLLQHGGTVFGALLLTAALGHWYLYSQPRANEGGRSRGLGGASLAALMLVLALAVGAVSGLSMAYGYHGPAALAVLSRETVVLGGSVLAFEVFVYSVAWRFVKNR
jgi:hypothetical protein